MSHSHSKAFDAKVRRGIFNPVARFLPDSIREDRLQDATAQTYEMYERYAQRGTVLDDAILVHSCRQRATDASRHFVKAGDCQRKRDALDPRHQLEGRLAVLHLDGVPVDGDGHFNAEGDQSLEHAFGLQFLRDPTEHIHSALDVESWLATLDEQARTVVLMRAAGYSLGEIADEACVSVSVVFQRCQDLGAQLATYTDRDVRRHRRSRRAKRTRAVLEAA